MFVLNLNQHRYAIVISDKNLAKESLDFHLNLLKQITDHIRDFQTKMPEQEFKAYCEKSGKVAYEILYEFINDISLSHPELKPEDFETIKRK